MSNLARKIEHSGALQEIGSVVRAEGSLFIVRAGSGELEARRAVSCLIEPIPGDVVLLATASSPGGRSYVLAVLEREAGARASIALDGDMEIKLRKGRFTVAAQEGVTLVSGKDVTLASAELDVNAASGTVSVDRLSVLGSFLRAEVEILKVFAHSLDSVMDRVSQKVKRSFRTVEELDQVKAAQVDYRATETMHLRGENTMIAADELVKVDAEQIHLG